MAISKTVPRTGRAAFLPGNAVDSLNRKALMMRRPKPNNPTIFFVLIGGINTSKAPSPSSHALVGS